MPHIALIPFEDESHLMPLMVVAQKLEAMDIMITIIFPKKHSHSLITGQYKETSEMKFEVLDESCEMGDGFVQQERGLENLLAKLAEDPADDDAPLPVVAVVADVMLPWVGAVAKKLLLPRYAFYPKAAINLAGMCGIVPEAPFQALSLSENGQILQHNWREDLQEAEGVLVNTSEALEHRAMESLRADLNRTLYVLAIGPLLPSTYLDHHSSQETDSPCKEWMDAQKPSSVLLIGSFGINLADDDVKEIAAGLEASKHPFLWVASEQLKSVVPEGFEERTKKQKQGFIISGWAAQHLGQILLHPCVGGFMTDCEWSSVSECICLAAAPMLCCPFVAHQLAVCSFLVAEAKVALQLLTVERNEVEKQVHLLFSGPQAPAMRDRLAQLKDATTNSVAKDGSSTQSLWNFVGDLYT